MLQEGCCYSSSTLEFEYSSQKELLIHQNCRCDDPNFCSCSTDSSDSSDCDSEPEPQGKLKVCMFSSTGDPKAQMLSQIKGLPESRHK